MNESDGNIDDSLVGYRRKLMLNLINLVEKTIQLFDVRVDNDENVDEH